MKNLGLWVALAKLVAAVIGWFQRRIGAAEERAKQKEERDALQKHYDEIDAAPLAPGDVFDRLRDRAAKARPGPDDPA